MEYIITGVNISLVAILWTIFIIIYSSNNKKWRYMPHTQTLQLLVFQGLQVLGPILYRLLDFSTTMWTRYLQLFFLSVGTYGSRINGGIIAVLLLLLTKGKARLVSTYQLGFLACGSVIPIIVTLILIFTTPGMSCLVFNGKLITL